MATERENVVWDTAGAIELLTVDRDDGQNFIRGVYADYWCAMAERWLFACLVVADAQRTVREPQRSLNLAGIRGLARPPDDWADYSMDA